MPTTGRHAAASRHRQLAAWQLAACMLGGAMLAGLAAMPADATILFSTITTSTSTQFEVSAPSIDRGLVTYLANPAFLGNPGYQQVVVTRIMPLGNLTKMTDQERAVLAAWVQSGAKMEP